jgi:hypothetical protein
MKKQILILITLFSVLALGASPAIPAQRDDNGLSVSPSSSEKSDNPNTVVTYALNISNNTGAEQNVSVSLTPGSHGWNAWSSSNSFTLADGTSSSVTISVAIKADAALGDPEVTTVNIQDGSGHSTSASLTTRAVPPPTTEVPTATLTPTETLTPSLTPSPTNTVTPTATIPASVIRPMVIISGYNAGGTIGPGDNFTLKTTFINHGQNRALNLVVTFTSDSFLMRNTGGVLAYPLLNNNEKITLNQPMTGSSSLGSSSAGTVTAKVAYTDDLGEAYSESFTLTVNTKVIAPTSTSGPWSTYTPTQSPRSQLVVTGYQTDVTPLQPGTSFELEMELRNTGSIDAHSVSMIVGGGVSESSTGTPEPGSTTGGNSDLSNFAPLGTSNLMVLGDVDRGSSIKIKTRLIVNVSTTPGAYPLKLSFVYTDAKNNTLVDNQVITMLVYSLPQVEVVFYHDPGTLVVGQPNPLPIQVTNLGRKSTILGSMKVTSDEAEVTNNVIQVGSIDAGGYFPLDAVAIPDAAGPITFNITINYNDDFNQLRTITQTLKVMAEDAPADAAGQPEKGIKGSKGAPNGIVVNGGAAQLQAEEESLGDKLVRVIRGFFGIDSAIQPADSPTLSPGDGAPNKDNTNPAPGGGGGGGGLG